MTNTFRLICEAERKKTKLPVEGYVISIRYSYERNHNRHSNPIYRQNHKNKGSFDPVSFQIESNASRMDFTNSAT